MPFHTTCIHTYNWGANYRECKNVSSHLQCGNILITYFSILENISTRRYTNKRNTVSTIPVITRPWSPDIAGVTTALDTELYLLCDLSKLAAALTDQNPVHLQTWDALGIC